MSQKLIKALKELKQNTSDSKAIESIDYLLSIDLPVFNIKKSESSGSKFPLSESDKDRYDFIIYTDGGCRGNPGPGGWGYCIQGPSEEFVLQDSGNDELTTNNKMELKAAIESLEGICEYAENRNENSSDLSVKLYSDSKYVVDGITKWVPGWKSRGWKKADKKTPENLELWQSFEELIHEFKVIDFGWVKGHSGHPQNDLCDQLANDAMDNLSS